MLTRTTRAVDERSMRTMGLKAVLAGNKLCSDSGEEGEFRN
jgi:hypothetical protein